MAGRTHFSFMPRPPMEINWATARLINQLQRRRGTGDDTGHRQAAPTVQRPLHPKTKTSDHRAPSTEHRATFRVPSFR